jgi:hypothetical protein
MVPINHSSTKAGVSMTSSASIKPYRWLPGDNGKKATLVNTKIVSEGDAAFDPTYDAPKYYDRMQDYHLDTFMQGKELWEACGGVHEALTMSQRGG